MLSWRVMRETVTSRPRGLFVSISLNPFAAKECHYFSLGQGLPFFIAGQRFGGNSSHSLRSIRTLSQPDG